MGWPPYLSGQALKHVFVGNVAVVKHRFLVNSQLHICPPCLLSIVLLKILFVVPKVLTKVLRIVHSLISVSESLS